MVTKAPAKSAPAKKALAKAPGKGIANVQAINDDLAERAKALSTQLGSSGGGPRIQLDNKAGVFVTGDGEQLGTEIRAIVIDFAVAHRYYEGVYNPNNLQPPVCAALGRDVGTMAPFEDAPKVQNDVCVSCPQNQFGSSVNGTGKACKNTRDVAMLLVNEDGSVDDKLYTFSIPPTGLGSFDGVAKFIARTYQSMPIRCIITMTVVDRGTYSTVACSDPEPNPDYAEHVALLAQAEELVMRKPDFTPRETAKPAAKGKAPAKRPAPRVQQRR